MFLLGQTNNTNNRDLLFLLIFLCVVYFGADNASKALTSISEQLGKVISMCSSRDGFWSLADSLVKRTSDKSVETPI